MANPSITALPDAPQRRMARDVYPVVADKWAAALGPWTTEVNAVVTWMGKQVDAIAASAKAASDSATAAGQAVTDAQAQVKLATDQAGYAKTYADTAKNYRDSAQVSAQAAQASAGLPPDNRPGWVLRQKLDGSGGVEWWLVVVNQVGDVITSTQAPDSTWLPTGRAYLQTVAPSLYAKIGAIADWQASLQVGIPAYMQGYPFPCIAFGNGVYAVVASSQGYHFWSNDGISWTQGGVPSGPNYCTMDFGNNKFVLMSTDYTSVATSTDGKTWSTTGSVLGATGDWRIKFGNGFFLAVSMNNGNMVTSSDGLTWNSRAVPGGNPTLRPAFGKGLFACVFGTTLMTSPNGINWTARTLPFNTATFPVRAIGFGNGIFMAVADSGLVATSVDGITWTAGATLPSFPTPTVSVLGYPGGFGIQFANNNVLYISANGQQWLTRAGPIVSGGRLEYVLNGSAILATGVGNTTGLLWRYRPYSYDPATQFLTTEPVQQPQGLNQYIKAS